MAATKTELQSVEARLQRVTGDLGVTSGLVATNAKELDILKHKGDRNYYDLTLPKGAKPTAISGISLVRRRQTRSIRKYSLPVESDDKLIEKRTRAWTNRSSSTPAKTSFSTNW